MYRVRDWDEHFENNRSRKMTNMLWIPVPNSHDGEGYAYIMSLKNSMAIYGAWHLILQVASKCHPRGTLVRKDGTPHTAATIAIKTRGNKDTIQKALDICASSEVCWLEALSEGGSQVPPPCHPTDEEGRKEGKNEEKEAKPLNKQQVLDTWNEIAERNSLPLLKVVSASRWEHYKARLKEYTAFTEAEFWDTVAAEIDGMGDFPRGKNDRGWKITFDYVVAQSGAKLVEGGWRRPEQPTTQDRSDLF